MNFLLNFLDCKTKRSKAHPIYLDINVILQLIINKGYHQKLVIFELSCTLAIF